MSPTVSLEEGQIVQLSPDCKNPLFAHCLMVVTERKPWGAQGFVPMLGDGGMHGGQAYYRATWDEMEHTGGKAIWMPA